MVEISHEFLKPALHAQAICVDATIGNGKDSVFFLQQNVKKIYGFEIQEDVLNNVPIRDDRWIPILNGHETMDQYIHQEVDAVIFNFGFCPNGNPDITTLPKTSVMAVEKALKLLKRKGRMALVLYPHQYGKEEQNEIENIVKRLDNHEFQIFKIQAMNVEHMPYMIAIEKR